MANIYGAEKRVMVGSIDQTIEDSDITMSVTKILSIQQ